MLCISTVQCLAECTDATTQIFWTGLGIPSLSEFSCRPLHPSAIIGRVKGDSFEESKSAAFTPLAFAVLQVFVIVHAIFLKLTCHCHIVYVVHFLTVALAIPADCLELNHLQREVPELAIDDFSDYEDDEHARRSSWTVWVPALKAAMDCQIKPKMS